MQTNFDIGKMPAVLYGSSSEKVYLFVHGKDGNKEEAAAFARLACPRGWQVLGVDLPGYGERKAERADFDPWHVVPELQAVLKYLHEQKKTVALRANSIGAWFSMLALEGQSVQNCLLVSPIVDMAKLIETMMGWANVTPQQLQRHGRIETSFGETLDWNYYQYAKEKQNLSWIAPTAILYAGKDNLTSYDTIERFSEQHACRLTIMGNGEHWFHTPQQLAVLEKWEQENL